ASGALRVVMLFYSVFFFFFFQAEDGIRDFHVTGVQTCALPISASRGEALGDGPVGAVCANCGAPNAAIAGGELDPDEAVCSVERSEERRVGKECRSRWAPDR